MNLKSSITALLISVVTVSPVSAQSEIEDARRILEEVAKGGDVNPTEVRQAMEDTTCYGLSSVAETMMRSRQNGRSMSQLLQRVSAQDVRPELISFQREVVIEAFETPQYQSPSVKENAISDFRDRWDVYCRKNIDQVSKIQTGTSISEIFPK